MLRNREAVGNSRVLLSPIINESCLPRIHSSVIFQPLVHRNPPHDGKSNLSSQVDAKRKRVKWGRGLACGSMSINCQCRLWKNTTPEEILIFLGVLMVLGVVKAREVAKCWNESEWGFSLRKRSGMSLNRFKQLKRFIHISRPVSSPVEHDTDWWHKLEPLHSHFRSVSKGLYRPASDLSFDEMMVRCEGRTKYRV